MSSSMGRIIPYIMENKTCSKPPTRYSCFHPNRQNINQNLDLLRQFYSWTIFFPPRHIFLGRFTPTSSLSTSRWSHSPGGNGTSCAWDPVTCPRAKYELHLNCPQHGPHDPHLTSCVSLWQAVNQSWTCQTRCDMSRGPTTYMWWFLLIPRSNVW